MANTPGKVVTRGSEPCNASIPNKEIRRQWRALILLVQLWSFEVYYYWLLSINREILAYY